MLQCNDSLQTLELHPKVTSAMRAGQMSLDEAMELSLLIDATPVGGEMTPPEHLQEAASRLILLHWPTPYLQHN